MLRGAVAYGGVSLAADFIKGGDIDIAPLLFYEPAGIKESYIKDDGYKKEVLRFELVADILSGKNSILEATNLKGRDSFRSMVVTQAMHYADVYEELRNDPNSP
jgi:hypothetical protein